MVIKYQTKFTEMDDPFKTAVRKASESAPAKPPWLSQPPPISPNIPSTTNRAIHIFLLSQRPNGSIGGIGWWQCANGYTAMALHDLWSGSKDHYATLDAAIRKCEARQRGLINVFNDDTLWWAMLCLHMYALGGDSWYLNIAKGIWRHIRDSRSICSRGKVLFHGGDMEGAVYWTTKPHEEQINAISTSLYAELSGRLALIARDSSTHLSGPESFTDYIEAARCSLGWVLRCRYRPRDGVVLDHIKLKQDKRVDWTFTYNTGVTLGACALLYSATGEEDYMVLACHMARKAMAHGGWVEANGVLTEKGAYGRSTHDPWKDNDSVGFKAVLVRQLGVLLEVIRTSGCAMDVAREAREMIDVFLRVNFQAQVERNSNEKGQYGPWWNGPFECPTSHAQMAVLDVMAAVRLVGRDGT